MGGNGGNGFIPVLNLDRGQSNIDGVSVRPVLGHLHPVTFADMLFAANWIPATNPRITSLKTNKSTAVRAPRPGKNTRGFIQENR